MAAEFDRMLFSQHLGAALELPLSKRWGLEGDATALEARCDMHPRAFPAERFQVRLRWSDYSKPPSTKFIDPDTGSESNPRSWPNIDGSRPQNCFICAPWTKEGNDHHPEWAASAAAGYKTPEEPLVFSLLQLQHLLDNTYKGRGA
jgi:hypothetical protein